MSQRSGVYRKGGTMYEEITTLITTVGFPIAAAVALFYLLFNILDEMKVMVKRNTETNEQIALTLKEVMQQVTEMRIQLERLETKVDKELSDAQGN